MEPAYTTLRLRHPQLASGVHGCCHHCAGSTSMSGRSKCCSCCSIGESASILNRALRSSGDGGAGSVARYSGERLSSHGSVSGASIRRTWSQALAALALQQHISFRSAQTAAKTHIHRNCRTQSASAECSGRGRTAARP
jgi:hypothetical protein